MPRANRCYLPGYVWHITHRCHKKEFLLRFQKDRRQWIKWLFDAKKRYGIRILNYTVTCNHVHLLVVDEGGSDVISKSIQLVAGRTGQEYNQRKGRRGAFWEDRYHATAVESGTHLIQCLIYVDMNMVRAGVVSDPENWPWGGYHEIQRPRERYRLIDHVKLMELLRIDSRDELTRHHRGWIEESLRNGKQDRESKWTESIAVGSRAFVEQTEERLGVKARGRSVTAEAGAYVLRESETPHTADSARLRPSADELRRGFASQKECPAPNTWGAGLSPQLVGGGFTVKNSTLSPDNTYYWDVSHCTPMG